MDMMGHDDVKRVTVRKSARVGYTKMLLAYLAYLAEHKRRNAVIYQPTDDDRDEFVTTELEPMLRDVRHAPRHAPLQPAQQRQHPPRQEVHHRAAAHARRQGVEKLPPADRRLGGLRRVQRI